MTDLLAAFGLVALAELGDKSQLLALSFATRYRWWQVLIGVAVAALVLLGLAAGFGGVLGDALPARAIAIGGGLLFLGFAVWTLLDADEDEDDGAALGRAGRSAIVTIVAAFTVAELGDKTMIATAALASTRPPIAVWLGGAAGMTLASGAAIAVGRLLHRRLPARRLRLLAAAAFGVFGVLLLLDVAST
ncbi:MAG: TMEM165/GDT1 family protein [Nitriliruptor sp.]